MYFVLILLMKFALTIFATESEGIFVKKKNVRNFRMDLKTYIIEGTFFTSCDNSNYLMLK